jgi:hypothetical protein
VLIVSLLSLSLLIIQNLIRPQGRSGSEMVCIFSSNDLVDPSVGVGQLESLFSRFGKIDSLKIIAKKECAFINYRKLQDAIDAQYSMQSARIGSCVVKIGFGKTENMYDSKSGTPTKSLWIGNIMDITSVKELESVFSRWKIESVRVLQQVRLLNQLILR